MPARLDLDDDVTPTLSRLVDDLHGFDDFAQALHHVTECARELIDVERVNLRLLDETRTRLLIAARSGPPMHEDQRTEFRIGEGLVGWVAANGIPLRLACADEDPRFALRSNLAAPIGSFVGVPVLDADGCIGVLSAASTLNARFSPSDEARLRLVAGIVSPHLQIVRLRRLAKTDPLTCVLNRHALDDVLPEIPQGDAKFSVAMIDLDHFKAINDRLGHAAGDETLRAAAAAIISVLRRDDDVVRIGGEEFLVVLPGVDVETARAIADRARIRIAEADVLPAERITASAGVTERRPDETRERLLHRVDAALYRAKALGRNRVVVE